MEDGQQEILYSIRNDYTPCQGIPGRDHQSTSLLLYESWVGVYQPVFTYASRTCPPSSGIETASSIRSQRVFDLSPQARRNVGHFSTRVVDLASGKSTC